MKPYRWNMLFKRIVNFNNSGFFFFSVLFLNHVLEKYYINFIIKHLFNLSKLVVSALDLNLVFYLSKFAEFKLY